MFGPLEFPGCAEHVTVNDTIICILCEQKFNFPGQKEECLSHIYEFHHLIISDVNKISNLKKYLKFWRYHFSLADIKTYCTTMLVDVKKGDETLKEEEFFLLSEILPLDEEIRKGLEKEKLEAALEQQRIEREDRNYKRGCLFCRNEIGPTRGELLQHLSIKHNLQLGRPENLVYVDKMIDIIEKKLEDLQCIYCEKYFKDRNVLKEHMRKKLHKRVNPKNKYYDQFYIINYLEPKKYSKNKNSESGGSDDEETSDWSDWIESLEVSIVCLFCPKASQSWEAAILHMDTEHRFHFEKNTLNFNFYEQVKLVNYIRRQIYKHKCITCDVQMDNNLCLLDHMEEEKHLILPDKKLWNQPEYYFPTYENDAFLSQLEDRDNSDSELSDIMCEATLSDSSGQLSNV